MIGVAVCAITFYDILSRAVNVAHRLVPARSRHAEIMIVRFL